MQVSRLPEYWPRRSELFDLGQKPTHRHNAHLLGSDQCIVGVSAVAPIASSNAGDSVRNHAPTTAAMHRKTMEQRFTERQWNSVTDGSVPNEWAGQGGALSLAQLRDQSG